MDWFKHYNTASDGASMELLWAAKDYETIAFYWFVLETVSKFEKDESRGKCVVSFAYFKRKLGWNFQRTYRVLTKFRQSFEVSFEVCSEKKLIELSIHNWLKLQENRGGKRLAKTLQNTGRSKSKEIKKEEVEVREQTSATQNFENSFRPEIVLFRNEIEKYGIDLNPSLKRILPRIAQEFEFNVEKFQSWSSLLVSGKSFQNIADKQAKTRYYIQALRKEVGL